MQRSRMRLAAILAAAAVIIAGPTIAVSSAAASPSGWEPLAAGPAPEANPLKGFIPYEGTYTAFPYSMEWSYFPLNSVMTGPGTFNWSALETALNDIASRSHQTALRFYLDYPGKPSGVPQYLLDGGLVIHSYDDYGNNRVSVSPNYDDPSLQHAMDQFIAAFGHRYDGDSRIGYIQAGLLGFWGEWHTYPYNGDGQPNWFASDATQQQVLTDYLMAFHTTQLEVRNPNSMNASIPIGYHDDSFALETKTSSLGWHFMDNMVAAGATDKWKTYSIGGELRPELQSCLFSASGCPILEDGGDNDFPGSVTQTHASWLINQYAFQTGYSAADRAAALAGSRSLGYSFTATEALAPAAIGSSSTTVGITIRNTGVAPFYEKWPITIAYLDAHGTVAASTTTDWHVSDIASGSSKTFTGAIDTRRLGSGTYTLVAQVTNPMKGGMPIRFANATQDATSSGWLTLRTSTVPSHGGPGGPGRGGHGPTGPGGGTTPRGHGGCAHPPIAR